MPQELGLPVYYKLCTQSGEQLIDTGTPLVEAGEYCGSTEGARGLNHHFYELKGEKRHVVLSGGQLNWRQKQGDLKSGGVYNVEFAGMEDIETGANSGSKGKGYKLELYTPQEVRQLVGDGAVLRNEVEVAPVVEDIVDARQDNPAESLGSLA